MLKNFQKSLSYAWTGIKITWHEGDNFKIQIVCAALAIVFGWILGISRVETAVVVLAIGLVLAAETFNTALEELCDKFQPTHDPHIGKIKDLSAGAVLITTVAAFLVALLVYLPHL